MELSEFNTKGFFADPKSPTFVEDLEKASDIFKVEIKGVNHRKLLVYIALMYDLASEARRNISQLNQRKFVCAVASGFLLKDNKFSEDVESAICGANDDAARMMTEYCMLSQGIDFTAYTAYSRIFTELVAQSYQKTTKDTVGVLGIVRKEISGLEDKMFGGDEVQNMRRSLYLSSKSVALNLQMEDIIDRIAKGDDLSEFNPFPDGYLPNKLTYAGETAPEE